MNCIHHPEAAVSAYCQNCGKPLCAQCVRSVSGVIYCEQCLAARLGMPGAGSAYTPGTAQFVATPGLPPSAPNPAAAAVLGLIPGVGAMYNGQFIKALIHVVIFVVLIGLASHYPLFGIFIAAWILYQAFEAYHTAAARRDGLPLPDHLGLNDLSDRLGFPPPRAYPAQTAAQTAQTTGQPYQAAVPPTGSYSPYGAAAPPPVEPYSPYSAAAPPYPPMPPAACGRPEPVGAIVLIIVGMLFLFSTLGVFQFDWVDHGWPIIIIAIGVWLLVRRSRGMHRAEAGQVPPPVPPSAPPAGPSAGPSTGPSSGDGL